MGRADDMLVVRGVNLFPSSVENIIRATPGATGEHQIVLDDDVTDSRTGYLAGIKVRVEIESGRETEAAAALTKAIRAELTVRAVVEPVPLGSLERSTHKSRRVIRT